MGALPCGCKGPVFGSEERPIIAGPENGAPPAQYRLLMNVGFANYGDVVWITGSAVPVWLQATRIELP